MRPVRCVLAAVLGVALALPSMSVAQTPGSNPLQPGFPQPTVATPTTTTAVPTISTATTPGSGSGLAGSGAIIIAIGAIVVLGGISLYIWRDARRRAPVRHHPNAESIDQGRRSGSKQKAKPRKLSAEERRRRKRGRAR